MQNLTAIFKVEQCSLVFSSNLRISGTGCLRHEPSTAIETTLYIDDLFGNCSSWGMAELNPMYRALRSRRQHQNLYQTAPLAAKFESCRQAFETLCIVTRSTTPSSSDSVVDSFGKFLTWGHDSGASARSLDRTLRKTSSLSEMTDELLMSLYSKLQEGKLTTSLKDCIGWT
jgi:hypothetical protein